MWKKIENHLTKVYSKKDAALCVSGLKALAKAHKTKAGRLYKLKSRDVALITYPNTIKSKNEPGLATLDAFLSRYKIKGITNILHILPFYPSDIDRGFSVLDYYSIDPKNGKWTDIKKISKDFKLMFDFVLNHASIDNPMVQEALVSRHVPGLKTKYKDFVVAYSEGEEPSEVELKKLTRPRPNPALTKYFVIKHKDKFKAVLGEPGEGLPATLERSECGRGWVWTTFSRPTASVTHQVDLNYANYKVLLEAVMIMLFYVEQGASFIRLDAVGYIWKKLGSSSIHEPEAHEILKVIKDVFMLAANHVRTVSETNESQVSVLKYLGSPRHVEADLVYQFSHFPLAVHAVMTGNAKHYSKWLNNTKNTYGRQFVPVFGTHDGMGLKPLIEILSEKQTKQLSNMLINKHEALANYAILPGGDRLIYEICGTPWSLINGAKNEEAFDLKLARYKAVLALGLMIRGIPAIYINGLIGVKNYMPKGGLDENRTVNREIFDHKKLYKELDNNNTHMSRVFKEVGEFLKIRKREKPFAPGALTARVIDLSNDSVVAQVLVAKNKKEAILGLVNVSSKTQKVAIDLKNSKIKAKSFVDLISQNKYEEESRVLEILLDPYQVAWLKYGK